MKPACSGPPLMPRKVSPSRVNSPAITAPALARDRVGVAGHVADSGVGEDRRVELRRLLELVVEPQAGADGSARWRESCRYRPRRGTPTHRPTLDVSRLEAWTSTPPTPTGSPGSPPARCRSRSPTRRPTRARCSSRRGPCHEDGVAVAVFPELCLTGYAIDDLFLQDTLLEAVAGRDRTTWSRQRRPAAGARRRRAAGARHPGAQLRGGDPPRPGPRRRAEVLPADLPRVLRAPLVRARATTGAARRSRSAAPRCRSAPT